MSQLEVVVQARFAELASNPTAAAQASAVPVRSSTPQSSQAAANTPFAKVNTVVPGSPAEQAGLQLNDQITRFGSATWLNHDKLSRVAEVVSQSEGVSWLSACRDLPRMLIIRTSDQSLSPSNVALRATSSRLHLAQIGVAEACWDVSYYPFKCLSLGYLDLK
jgi:hypothetical protein